MYFDIIVACENKFGIGYEGSLPWKTIPHDLRYFHYLTSKSVVIMGRKTWESIPIKFRPLSNRINYIITKKNNNHEFPHTVSIFNSLIDALYSAWELFPSKAVFVIGGQNIMKLY